MNIFDDFADMFSNAFTNIETRTETSDLSTFEFISDLDDTYEILLTLPGFDKKNISVSLSENSLKVTAKDNSLNLPGYLKTISRKIIIYLMAFQSLLLSLKMVL